MKPQKYEVLVPGDLRGTKEWIKCKIAREVNQGFLHYELKDGTNGLAKPGTWRCFEFGRV